MASILIIDDDEQIRQLLQQMLQGAGYETVVAENGKVGMKCYRQNRPDLVITDLIMPEKEGMETIVELKKEYSDAKIIAISGGGRLAPENYLAIAKRLGAAYTFTKPLERKALLEAVASLLKESTVA
jgi:DNA-binding NtrC family response regulator